LQLQQVHKNMGTLKVFSYDFNNPKVVRCLLATLKNYIENQNSAYFDLDHQLPYYFSILKGSIVSVPGWYVILKDKTPIYVGTAKDLDNRLNSPDGSRDNFGSSSRKTDAERNLIKKFTEIGIIVKLRVVIIPISVVDSRVSINDRKQIEKLINIFRSTFNYL